MGNIKHFNIDGDIKTKIKKKKIPAKLYEL